MSREWDDNGSDIPVELWERGLENAINSKRGQAFLRELEAELLAMKERGEGRLIRGCLISDGTQPEDYSGDTIPAGCCTLGVIAKKRGPEWLSQWINREMHDPYDFPGQLSKTLNIASSMIAEIGNKNDQGDFLDAPDETPEQRFERMLKWVQEHIAHEGKWVHR